MGKNGIYKDKLACVLDATGSDVGKILKVKSDGSFELGAAGGGGGYTLPIATNTTLGGVKPDENTLTVDGTTGVASLKETDAKNFFTFAEGINANGLSIKKINRRLFFFGTLTGTNKFTTEIEFATLSGNFKNTVIIPVKALDINAQSDMTFIDGYVTVGAGITDGSLTFKPTANVVNTVSTIYLSFFADLEDVA